MKDVFAVVDTVAEDYVVCFAARGFDDASRFVRSSFRDAEEDFLNGLVLRGVKPLRKEDLRVMDIVHPYGFVKRTPDVVEAELKQLRYDVRQLKDAGRDLSVRQDAKKWFKLWPWSK